MNLHVNVEANSEGMLKLIKYILNHGDTDKKNFSVYSVSL